MQNDPTQSSTHPVAVNPSAHKKADLDKKDNTNTGLPKQDDEELVEDDTTTEDFVKFNVDKVDELKKSKEESTDKK